MNREESAAMINHINDLWPKEKLTPARQKLFTKALSKYPLQVATDAIDDFALNDRYSAFCPMPGQLQQYLPRGAQHPGPDEAWAIALNGSDERNSVIWTNEIAQAWAIASDIFHDGDKIGSRMAFKDAYSRIIQNAPPPRAVASIGWDQEGRKEIVEKGIAIGALPSNAESVYLPSPEGEYSCAKLLTGPEPENKDLAQRWGEIQASITKDPDPVKAREEKRINESKTTEERRRVLLNQAKELMGERNDD